MSPHATATHHLASNRSLSPPMTSLIAGDWQHERCRRGAFPSEAAERAAALPHSGRSCRRKVTLPTGLH
eukprot:240656-Chlamydomonas_euryale.AAC.1